MKKKDLILASAMFIVALVWFLITSVNKEDGNSMIVYKNNEVLETHLLRNDGEYTIEDDGNVIMRYIITDGTVDVIYADCKDQICVNGRPVSRNKDVIVCLPNKIVIEISQSDADSTMDDYDAVVY